MGNHGNGAYEMRIQESTSYVLEVTAVELRLIRDAIFQGGAHIADSRGLKTLPDEEDEVRFQIFSGIEGILPRDTDGY
jgi:hypothetical protein